MRLTKTNRTYLVIAVALLTRLIYLAQYGGTPFYSVPMWDAGEYNDMAIALSKGHLHHSFAFRPALYPLLLGIVYMIFGVGPLFPSLLQIAVGVYACVLVQRITTRLFGDGAGLGAGLAAALCGMMVFFDLELMPTGLEALLMLLLIESLIKIVDNRNKKEIDFSQRRNASGALAGLWFALSVLTRPVMLPLMPVILIWMWSIKVGWQNLMAFVGIGLSALLVTMLINVNAGNGPLMTPAQGGVNFYIGNRPGADGFTATLPNVGPGWGWDTIWRLADKAEGRELTAIEVDSHYWKLGGQEIAADPVAWVKLIVRKAWMFWNHLEISNDRDIYYHAHRYPVIGWLLWIGVSLFLPFAMVGLWVAGQDRRVTLLNIILMFYTVVVVMFFVNGRFRHPLTPILIILAAGGVKWVVENVRGSKFQFNRDIAGALIFFSLGIYALFAVDTGINPKRWDYGYFTEGTALEKMGRVEQAELMYLKALTANKNAPFVNFNLGNIERNRAHIEKSREYYYNEVEIQPYYGKAWNNLGLMEVAAGNFDRALECFEEALRVRPDLSEAAVNAAQAWQRRGDEARENGDQELARRSFDRVAELRKSIPLSQD